MSVTFESLRMLDEVFGLPQLEKLDSHRFLQSLAGEIGSLTGETLGELSEQLDALLGVLDGVDRFAQRSMGVRLTQTPGMDVLPTQLRTLVTATVASYQHDLGLLRDRVSAALVRNNPHTAQQATQQVMAAAERVLGDRALLRAGVLQLARELAGTRLPLTERGARDHSLREDERRRWGQAREDLRQIAAHPEVLATGSFAERLSKIPPPPDEPEPEPTVSRTSLLEID